MPSTASLLLHLTFSSSTSQDPSQVQTSAATRSSCISEAERQSRDAAGEDGALPQLCKVCQLGLTVTVRLTTRQLFCLFGPWLLSWKATPAFSFIWIWFGHLCHLCRSCRLLLPLGAAGGRIKLLSSVVTQMSNAEAPSKRCEHVSCLSGVTCLPQECSGRAGGRDELGSHIHEKCQSLWSGVGEEPPEQLS